jgi:hypothetical protein
MKKTTLVTGISLLSQPLSMVSQYCDDVNYYFFPLCFEQRGGAPGSLKPVIAPERGCPALDVMIQEAMEPGTMDRERKTLCPDARLPGLLSASDNL